MEHTVLEKALRHDRILMLGGLLIITTLAWAYLFMGAGMSHLMAGDMPRQADPWTWRYTVIMLTMWIVMMAAMMLPSVTSMLLLFMKITHARQTPGQCTVTVGVFALGYLAAWTGFSLVAVALQFGLETAAFLSPMMQVTNTTLAGMVLIAAGIYQWTPLKHTCLRHCRSPLDYVLSHWRTGRSGAFLMGCHHGLYCVGCCWMIMLLLFVGGVMNLLWIAGLAILVLGEKLLPAGHWLSRSLGLVLLLWGLATVLLLGWPTLASTGPLR